MFVAACAPRREDKASRLDRLSAEDRTEIDWPGLNAEVETGEVMMQIHC